MRQIVKSEEPGELSSWKTSEDWSAGPPAWGQYTQSWRSAVVTRLVADQFNLCCYCCASIARGDYHVEHFRPKGLPAFSALTYDWQNLLASCEGWPLPENSTPTVKTQRHCGAHKENWFAEGVTISPLIPGVEAQFRYTGDGDIKPAQGLGAVENDAVEQNIRHLNMRSPSLMARRSQMLAGATADGLQLAKEDWVNRYLTPDANGGLAEFWPALNYLYQQWHEDWWP